jgi:hypothetical protein
VRVRGQVIGNPAPEAAILFVDRVVDPKGQYVGKQLRFHFLPQALHEGAS